MIGGNLRNHHRSRPAHSSDSWVRHLLRIQWGISRVTKRPYAISKIEQGEMKPTVTACCGHFPCLCDTQTALTVNVVFKFVDNEFLLRNYAFEQIADGDNTDYFLPSEHGQMTHTLLSPPTLSRPAGPAVDLIRSRRT
jgi:hypothetical protein